MGETMKQPDVSTLGKQISIHAGTGLGGKIGMIFMGLMGVAIGLGGLGWGISMIIEMLQESRPPIGFIVVMLIVILVMLLAGIGISAFAFVNLYRSIGLAVAVHENGILHTQRDQQIVIPWDSITQVWYQPYTIGASGSSAQFEAYQMEVNDGTKIIIDQAQIPDAGQIGYKVMQITQKRLLPLYIEKIENSETLAFEPAGIIVSKTGLQHKTKMLGWEDIAGVISDQKKLEFRIMQRGIPGQKDRVWHKTMLAWVPNPDVLSGMIQHFSTKQQE